MLPIAQQFNVLKRGLQLQACNVGRIWRRDGRFKGRVRRHYCMLMYAHAKNGPVVYKRLFADDDGEFNPPFLNTMIRMNACMTRKIFVLNWFSMTMTPSHEKKFGLAFRSLILLILYVSFKSILDHEIDDSAKIASF